MDLLLLGAGMGVAGGLFPSPLHMIALGQVALKRWTVALLVLVGAPLVVDGALLLVTFFFYQYIPHNVARDVAYLGGAIVLAFGAYSLAQARGKSQEEMARSGALTYTSVSVGACRYSSGPLHLGQTRISSRSGARLMRRIPGAGAARPDAASCPAP